MSSAAGFFGLLSSEIGALSLGSSICGLPLRIFTFWSGRYRRGFAPGILSVLGWLARLNRCPHFELFLRLVALCFSC